MQSKAPFPSSPQLPAALVQDHTALPEPPTKLVEEHITLGPRCWFLSDHKLTCAWGCPPKQPSGSSSLCPHLPPLIPSNLGISLPSEHACVEHSVLVDTDHTDCSICVCVARSVFTWLSLQIWAAAEAQSLVKRKVTGTHGHGGGQSHIPQGAQQPPTAAGGAGKESDV